MIPILQRKFPVSLIHFVTNRCNARCDHCFIDFDNPAIFKNQLSLSEIKYIIRNLPSTVRNINLTGGEPMLRKDIMDITEAYLQAKGIKSIYLTTNGYHTDTILDLASTVEKKFPKKRLFISISLDDFEKQHDQNRHIKGLAYRAKETYSQIKSRKYNNITPVINLTLTPNNCGRAIEIYNYFTNELGATDITLGVIRGKKLNAKDRNCVIQAYAKLSQLMEKNMNTEFNKSFMGRVLKAKNVIMRSLILRTLKHNSYITPCYAGSLIGVIASDGTVYPCELLSKRMGDLRKADYDIKKIWLSNNSRKQRRFIRDTKCFCTYECAWTLNILFNPKYYPLLTKKTIFG